MKNSQETAGSSHSRGNPVDFGRIATPGTDVKVVPVDKPLTIEADYGQLPNQLRGTTPDTLAIGDRLDAMHAMLDEPKK